MSFFLDWWMLILLGVFGAFVSTKLKQKHRKIFTASYFIGILALFYIVSAAMYANLDFAMPLLNWLQDNGVYMGENQENIGFNFMINSGVFSFDVEGGPSSHPTILFVSILLFATYSFWLLLGLKMFKFKKIA
ncbi:MAG: hypothetical protein PHW96_01895 [Candidatus Nanoarchaeia archaeon]|nr:hypothetical protein [Candidatus Nanoarchaeia archaeon]